MKYYYLLLLFYIGACQQRDKPGDAAAIDKIPKMRSAVNKQPVASYLIPVGDPRLDRKFGVDIYETKFTFKYLLVMQYDGMIQND